MSGRSVASELVVRRSWVTYVAPLLRILAVAALTLVYLAFWPEVRAFWSETLAGSPEWVDLLAVAPVLLITLPGLAGGVWRMLENRSAVLRIGNDAITFRSGILPWKRREMYWKYHHIYQARHVTRPPFLAWLLRFGDVVIIGKEGSTREYRVSGVHDPKRAQMTISARCDRVP